MEGAGEGGGDVHLELNAGVAQPHLHLAQRVDARDDDPLQWRAYHPLSTRNESARARVQFAL